MASTLARCLARELRRLLLAVIACLASLGFPGAAAAAPTRRRAARCCGAARAAIARATSPTSSANPASIRPFQLLHLLARLALGHALALHPSRRGRPHALARDAVGVHYGTGLSPAELARGEGDGFLVVFRRLLGEHGGITYLRPLSEMNNGNNPYSPYDLSGRSRGRAFSTKQFKKAAAAGPDRPRRRGGRDRREAAPAEDATGAHRCRGAARAAGGAHVGAALVRQPGALEEPPQALLAGWRLRRLGGHHVVLALPQLEGHEQPLQLSRRRSKPFAFAEWGVWGADVPGFVSQFFGFLKSHPRVRMAVYYQSASLKPEFRLSTHPASRAALRRAVSWPRLTGFAPELAP